MRLFRLSLAMRTLESIYSTTTDLYSLKPSKTQ
ncbi:hypothetical protein T4D_7885 [Trichinella pseudospiralis]|uniref:Uncharacterized protein n=1 Tax=Trichinella pseudospiralis TaxID=6337 RepID=A0A0V1C3G2_TRIPS|nr:hypothetical protein T4D_10481 [Trichinella pseudospiralis]KRY62901.1 hypothetical protein T4D_3236 [Trichinella pseudospiralis]KRY63454.1 hypothetical protein T4D_7885 [Trichinella pseudospiralis]